MQLALWLFIGYLVARYDNFKTMERIRICAPISFTVEPHMAGQPNASVGVSIGSQLLIYFADAGQLFHLASEVRRGIRANKMQPVGRLFLEQPGPGGAEVIEVDRDTPVGAHMRGAPGEPIIGYVTIGATTLVLRDRLAVQSLRGALDYACHVAQDTFVYANPVREAAPGRAWLPETIGIRLDSGALLMPRAD